MAAQPTTLETRLEFAREAAKPKPTPGQPKPRPVKAAIPAPPIDPTPKPREKREARDSADHRGTTGYTFPPVHGAKRKAKDRHNQLQKQLTGRGPAKTPKG